VSISCDPSHVTVLRCVQFFGDVPEGLSKLTSLQRLDLTGNLLSGTIPSSYSALTQLT
jgi:hypothetical protein